MHSNAKFLGLLDANSKVLISRNQNGIADRAVPSERNHVCHYQRVHALLLAHAVHKAKSDFDILQMRKSEMLRRRTGGGAVIPINPEKGHSGYLLSKCSKCLNCTFVCDMDFCSL